TSTLFPYTTLFRSRTHLSCPTTSCPSETIMLLMLDNYDSFTYNLVQYFGELGVDVVVHRNDQITLEDIDALNPDHLCISPGPGRPETRSEEHTSELQSRENLVCRLLLEKKKKNTQPKRQ